MDATTLFSELQAEVQAPAAAGVDLGHVVIAILISFGLALIIAWTYQATYKGVSYTQSYVYTLIMLSMIVTVIMLVVGSNIARAFTLIGGLSVIRFRNAVKDTQDIAFVFWVMAVGMACGAGFYGLAAVSTLLLCIIWWGLSRFNLFTRELREQLLKIRLPGDGGNGQIFNDIFARYLSHSELMAVESIQSGLLTELVYGVELKPKANPQAFISELRRLNDNNRVVLVTGYHEVDL